MNFNFDEDIRDPNFGAMSFDQFIAFFFDRHVQAHDSWTRDYLDFELPIDSRPAVVAHLTRLFTEFAEVARRFRLEQIDRGIWAILSEPFRLQETLWIAS